MPFGSRSADVAGPGSYLNDVRISPGGKYANLTHSGVPGGLLVTDFASGKAWRVLSGDPSAEMEKDAVVIVDGEPLRRPDNGQPMFNADGIALSHDGKTLYWQAVTGKTLSKIGTEVLQAATGKLDAASGTAEKVATTEPRRRTLDGQVRQAISQLDCRQRGQKPEC